MIQIGLRGIAMKKTVYEIEQEATENVTALISEFGKRIEEGTANAERFKTLDDIEQRWSQLRRDTEQVYTDMVSEIISGVDEGELISKKKESGANGESR